MLLASWEDGGSQWCGLLAAGTTYSANADLLDDDFRRAESREGGLNQIAADKDGEQKPPLADPMGEGDAGQDKSAGEDTDGIFQFHTLASWSKCLYKVIIDYMTI